MKRRRDYKRKCFPVVVIINFFYQKTKMVRPKGEKNNKLGYIKIKFSVIQNKLLRKKISNYTIGRHVYILEFNFLKKG